jgi:polysaccharide pyruvyl transferase WcaK-like protein
MFRLGKKKQPAPVSNPLPGLPRDGYIRHVHLIDTSVASDNLGDEIIVEAVRAALLPIFRECYVTTSSGHDGLGPYGRELVAQADIAVLMGTNALAAFDQSRRRRFVWTVPPEDAALLAGKVVLCGVGANAAFDTVDPAQAAFLRQVLSPTLRHSVRDGLGLAIVKACGRDGINTSCPTLWGYLDAPPQVPEGPQRAVCFTLTRHRPDPIDALMVAILKEIYAEVHFWPQQPRDLSYLEEIAGGLDGIHVLAPSLAAYDALLASGPMDVVGTRLHGGIRGLRHGRRVLIVAIDNRATEIGRETGLSVIARADVPQALKARLQTDWPTRLHLPKPEVAAFLGQFRAVPYGTRAITT